MLLKVKRYREAELPLLAAYQLSKQTSELTTEQTLLKGQITYKLGYIQQQNKNFEGALKYYNELIIPNDNHLMGIVYNSKAECYNELKQIDNAINSLRESISIFENKINSYKDKENTEKETSSSKIMLAMSYNNLSGYYAEIEKYQEARENASKAVDLFQTELGKHNDITKNAIINYVFLLQKLGDKETINKLATNWESETKQAIEQLQEFGKQQLSKEDLELTANKWKALKELNPPGFLVPSTIFRKQKESFGQFWKNQF